MNVQVILLPCDLTAADVTGKTVVVFDVLRATTTMTAALAAGVKQLHVFDSLDAARVSADLCTTPRLLCGEINALCPPGFDRGNRPRDWIGLPPPDARIFMATTNGTRAITSAAALKPATMLIGALINANAVATAAAETTCDVTLLCSGTNGQISLEDVVGAGAVLDHMITHHACHPSGDIARLAHHAFLSAQTNLPTAMRQAAGGRNLIRVGLEADIDDCAAINSTTAVGFVDFDPLCVKPLAPSPEKAQG